MTHHLYSLGAGIYLHSTVLQFRIDYFWGLSKIIVFVGVDHSFINKIQDPYYLNQVGQTYQNVSKLIKDFGPWLGAWVGESGGA